MAQVILDGDDPNVTKCYCIPANLQVRQDRARTLRERSESSILFSFGTDFLGRVKARGAIEPGGAVVTQALTPAVILFIALPEADDNTDPG